MKPTGIISLFLCMLLSSLNTTAQSPYYKVFLIGDAGDDEMTHQTLDSLKSRLNENPNSAVIFLGDNSYRNLPGLPFGYKGFDSSAFTQKNVRAELDVVSSYKGAVYFVPGNHDWWNVMSIKRGLPKLKMEENFIEQNLSKNTGIKNPNNTFLPKDGQPGPAQVELADGHIRVIFIDTHWLMMAQYKRNGPGSPALAQTFYHNLDSLMAEATAKKQKILVVAHHPVYYLPYNNKHYPLWILPKKIKQSAPDYVVYRNMSAQINDVLKKYPGAYFAAGHLHAMQYHTTPDGVHHIISGAGSRLIHVKEKDAALANTHNATDGNFWNDKGFFELNFYNNTEKLIIYHYEGKKRCDPSEVGGCK